MKKKIIYGLLLAVAMVTASSSFVSCKDYEGDDYAALKEENAGLRAYLDAQIAAIKQCNCDLTQYVLLSDLASRGYLTADALNGYAKTSDLSEYLKTSDFASAIQNNSQTIIDLIIAAGFSNNIDLSEYAKLSDLAGFLKASDLEGFAKTSDLEGFLKMADLVQLSDSVKNAYTWALYSYTRLVAQGDSLKGAYDSINVVRTEAWNNFVIAKNLANQADSLAKVALDSIGKVDGRISDLKVALEAADSKLQGQIDALNTRVAATEKSIDNVLGSLKKQITGVIIQSAYSPVLGNGSLPLGIQTNLLAAYVGVNQTGRDVIFPSYIGGDYANGEAALTGEDYDYLQSLGLWPEEVAIASGDIILSDKADNAGKLYVTVNPTNIDFEGTDFNLVNSKGEKAKVELSPLKGSDEVLKFGWTRAGVETPSANGFYEVNAKIAKENVADLQPAINNKKFEEAFKEELVNDPSRGLIKYVAMMDLVRAIYGSLEPLQRFGVQATWQDPVAGKRSYTSALDVAATIVSPLGFGFTIPESKYTRLPIFDTEYFKNRLHLKRVDAIKVKEGKIFVEGVSEDGTVVKVDATSLYEDVYGQLNAAYTSTLNDVNKRIDYFVNFINRYNKYASKVDAALANANYILQPVLLWTDGENAGELGGVVYSDYRFGTQVKAGSAIGIVPTSYSLELLAPAYKKNVIVTNVYMTDPSTGVQVSAQGAGNRNGMEDALKEINAAINATKLIDDLSINNPFVLDVKPEYVGMTFEFTYTAVDYTGQIAGRKFYLTVAE